MRITIICSKCKKPVDVVSTEIDFIDDIAIKILPCNSIECRNCSDCEIEQENEKLKGK